MGSSSLVAARMTKKYSVFLPEGAKIINYAEKASGRDCGICGHTPEKRPPKPGYPDVSEEMRLMRVRLPEGVRDSDIIEDSKVDFLTGFTVTGTVIELNVCKDTANCRERSAALKNSDGTPKFDDHILGRFN